MADLVNGTDIQTVFLPDGSILITQEGTGDVGVASSDYWQWDDEWLVESSSAISVDALLKAVGQKDTAFIDALLQTSGITSSNLDAVLTALLTIQTNIDAVIKKLASLGVSLDAVIQAAVSVTALSYGEENPTDGEATVGWDTWSDGAGGSPTIIGDSQWGQLQLLTGEIAHGPVYNMGAGTHNIKLTEDKYGSGIGNFKIYIRGQAGTFGQDDGSPAWEEYTNPVVKTWEYIQVKLEGQ